MACPEAYASIEAFVQLQQRMHPYLRKRLTKREYPNKQCSADQIADAGLGIFTEDLRTTQSRTTSTTITSYCCLSTETPKQATQTSGSVLSVLKQNNTKGMQRTTVSATRVPRNQNSSTCPRQHYSVYADAGCPLKKPEMRTQWLNML